MLRAHILLLSACCCLLACSEPAMEEPPVFQHQLDSLEKARQVENDLLKKHQQQRQQIDTQSR